MEALAVLSNNILCLISMQTKVEMQQKNAMLTEALTRVKEELRSAERDRVSLEDEKRRMQTQLTNTQRQIATTEASLESANQVIYI